jgi:hypothetical protein
VFVVLSKRRGNEGTWADEITSVLSQRSCSICYTHGQIAGALFRSIEIEVECHRRLL